MIYCEKLLLSGEENPYYSNSDIVPLCYHHPMLTQENRETRTSELQSSIDNLHNYAEIEENTNINYNDDPLYATQNKQQDPKSIHFTGYNNSPAERTAYENYLITEIQLRDITLPATMDIEDTKTLLKIQIGIERKIVELALGKKKKMKIKTKVFFV